MIVFDSSLDHIHTMIQKFTSRWFRPYEVQKAFGTYQLSEQDRTILRVPIAGKQVKIFKKQSDAEPYATPTQRSKQIWIMNKLEVKKVGRN